MNLFGLLAQDGKVSVSKQPSITELIDQFQTDIHISSMIGVHPLPDFKTEIDHESKYVQVGRRVLQGVYLDNGDPDNEGIYGIGTDFAFQAQPANRLTREDSHNKVFFGRFWIIPEDDGSEAHVQVAVKTREAKSKESLIGEAALFQHIGSLGLETFYPAGLVIGSDSVHLMTYFRGQVATMDTVDWNETTPAEAWSELRKAVDTMYKLHTNMLFHGDLKFRNVAFNETGETVIIDPELMTSPRNDFEKLFEAGVILNEDQRATLNALALRMSHEFTALCESIDEQIIPTLPRADRPRRPEAYFKLYKTHLFEPYRNLIREAEEPIRGVLLRIFDEIMVRKKAKAKADQL